MKKFIPRNTAKHPSFAWKVGPFLSSFWEYITLVESSHYDVRSNIIPEVRFSTPFQTNGISIWIRDEPKYTRVIEEYNSLCEEE